ncbi:hypothetical protein AWE51_00280 [Aquimarina aggregata]|uniref:Nucleoside 2-deoxyribosyltransferase n=1 Tax=Aquimarina aggregata TaxID=1642818 RepID=A0A162DKT8_9FLAO|nr:hypothetical protein [Aquimarina aggregata]KZS41918.1 hypothetical protein AWE51_00280 [Aquimarina aggregata]
MEKICFIIMPISNHPNYSEGHFKRVYNHIIKPACERANFHPLRADDISTTNHIAIDIIKKIIESDMAICDLSSQNPNVLYELGIRQAFNKPVALIKDIKTKRIFDIQGFRDLEYDENLRIDNVEDIIEALAETITLTYENHENEVNSLVKLLGINSAEIGEGTKISAEGKLILNNINAMHKRLGLLEKKSLPRQNETVSISEEANDDFDEEYALSLKEISNLQRGEIVSHRRFGIGKVLKLIGSPNNLDDFGISIDFPKVGIKTLLVRFSRLYKQINLDE